MMDENEQSEVSQGEHAHEVSEPVTGDANESNIESSEPGQILNHQGIIGDSRERSNLEWISEEYQGAQEEIATSSAASRSTSGETLARVALGSALLTLDTASDWIEQARDLDQATAPSSRTAESVLVPVSEWEGRFGDSPNLATRYLALGMMIDAKSKASRATRLARGVSDLVANGLNVVFGPLGRSKTFSPVRRSFNTSVDRGETQVRRWIELGRVEDEHSRMLAQTTVGQIADEAMDEVVENERIEQFIQEIVSAQSMGIIDEAIEEVRERTLSTDIFLERPFRRLLRRPNREEVAPPEYDPEIVRPVRRRSIPLQEGSLLGYYAGFMSRLFAFALDIAILAAFMAISSWLLTTIISLLGLESAFTSFKEAATASEVAGTIFVSLYGISVVLGYFIVFWVLTGQTFGMMILGLRVVAHDGDPLTVLQAVLRIVGFAISFSLFFIGFAWILIDDKREGWPDKIARSYVVYAWDANPDESFLFDYIGRHY